MARSSDSRIIRELADILNETNLSEIEIEKEGLRIRVARMAGGVPQITYATSGPAPALAAAPSPGAAAPEAPAASEAAQAAAGKPVKAPMVGTIYLAPDPNSAPFIKVGDTVSAGQTLFIIEAMKTMNPVTATHGGTVSAILVTDGQPVEFDEVLTLID